MDPQAAPNEPKHVLPGRMITLGPAGLYSLLLVLEHHEVPEGKIVCARRMATDPTSGRLRDVITPVRRIRDLAQRGAVSTARGFKGYVWTDDTGEAVWRPDILDV